MVHNLILGNLQCYFKNIAASRFQNNNSIDIDEAWKQNLN